MELESNGCLPFLDVLLCRKPDGSICTSVYRKDTHTDKYLDFSSQHPLLHKIATVHTLCSRAETHTSLASSRLDEVNHALRWNGYPMAFVSRHSSRFPLQKPVPPKSKSKVDLPYVCGLSEALRRILVDMEIYTSFLQAPPNYQAHCVLAKGPNPRPS